MSTIAAQSVSPRSIGRRSVGQSSVGQSSVGQSSVGPVRLTRRGRAVVVGGAVSLILAVGVVLGDGSVATEDAGTAPDTRIVAVGPGDTLWDIASEIAAPGETREVVDEIQRLNALDSAMVMAGQRLRVPVAG